MSGLKEKINLKRLSDFMLGGWRFRKHRSGVQMRERGRDKGLIWAEKMMKFQEPAENQMAESEEKQRKKNG